MMPGVKILARERMIDSEYNWGFIGHIVTELHPGLFRKDKKN